MKMSTESLLSHRHLKFWQLGGFVEADTVEPEKKRNMKSKGADIAQVTAEIELEIDNLKKKARDTKSQPSGTTISEAAMEKLRQEVDKEMTGAFISMGLQEKLEAIKMELCKSSETSDSILSPSLKERVDKLAQEFNQALSRPASYLSLKQKLKTRTEASRIIEKQTKAETLKKEINEKLQGQVKGKMEILRKARDKVAKGEQLDESMKEEVERAKEELKEMLTHANLEVVGLSKRKLASAPPNLEKKMAQVEELIGGEIERAVDTGGFREKINKLKVELRSTADKEKGEGIREGDKRGNICCYGFRGAEN
uniref:Acetyl-coenzyme A carboxylase carboxyl transferase subunit alpha, chloroplastic n=1 Tax=Anthurium amnicola TaxID=1678845 RepID=A0A1D1ZBJ7_9ARAE